MEEQGNDQRVGKGMIFNAFTSLLHVLELKSPVCSCYVCMCRSNMCTPYIWLLLYRCAGAFQEEGGQGDETRGNEKGHRDLDRCTCKQASTHHSYPAQGWYEELGQL